jgi:hypothetical protein
MKRSSLRRMSDTKRASLSGPVFSTITAKPKAIKPKKRTPEEMQRIYGGEYGNWLVTQPCLVSGLAGHQCWGAIRRCHTANGGMSRKADAPTQVPMCDGAHALQHSIGVKSFEKVYSVDLKASAASYRARWLAEGER